MKKLLLCLSALFLSVSFATAQTYEINQNTGTLTNGNNTTKSKTWSSTELDGLTLVSDFAEAMNVNNGLQLYAYNNGKVTYTINAPESHSISAYTIKYKKGSSSYTITLSAEGVEPQTPGRVSSEQTFEVTGLSGASAVFTLEGTAVRDFIKNVTISVTLEKEGDSGEGEGDGTPTTEELYASIVKPTFGKAGNTTFVKAATLAGDVNAEVAGIQAVAGQGCVTNAIEVAAGAEFDLNITYQLNWGDLAIYQIDNDGTTKEYGYYYGSWEADGSTEKVAQNIADDGISVTEVVDGACTATFPITINENQKPGEVIVVRAITGIINNATNSAYEQGITEGGYVDFLFVVTDAVADESYKLTVGESGYATLFLDFPAAIPADVKAYTVTAVNTDNVTLTEVTGVLPANTGIIVNASQGNYYFIASTETPADVTGNLLKGSVADENIQGEAYVLGDVEGVALYKAHMNGTSWLNNANRAYLPIASGQALSTNLRFDFGGTTAIEEVETEAAETVIYDLTGRRVNEITKAGVYIVGGKKILVK